MQNNTITLKEMDFHVTQVSAHLDKLIYGKNMLLQKLTDSERKRIQNGDNIHLIRDLESKLFTLRFKDEHTVYNIFKIAKAIEQYHMFALGLHMLRGAIKHNEEWTDTDLEWFEKFKKEFYELNCVVYTIEKEEYDLMCIYETHYKKFNKLADQLEESDKQKIDHGNCQNALENCKKNFNKLSFQNKKLMKKVLKAYDKLCELDSISNWLYLCIKSQDAECKTFVG